MLVSELVSRLLEMDGDAEVVIDTGETDGGCSTCGWGGLEIVKEIDEVLDMEGKVCITACY